jgi:hypothetical protein
MSQQLRLDALGLLSRVSRDDGARDRGDEGLLQPGDRKDFLERVGALCDARACVFRHLVT